MSHCRAAPSAGSTRVALQCVGETQSLQRPEVARYLHPAPVPEDPLQADRPVCRSAVLLAEVRGSIDHLGAAADLDQLAVVHDGDSIVTQASRWTATIAATSAPSSRVRSRRSSATAVIASRFSRMT